ncbi:MAG: glycoside hydrolase family 43 protein [Clostridia bacterium]|nr:glycoside hydrolase family 43 protein [Clostridia bacterium]
MKRTLAIILTALMILTAIPFCSAAYAAEQIVYLDAEKGSDSADGRSASSALKTLPAAISAVANSGGKIVLVSDLSLTGSEKDQFVEPAHTGKIIITSNDGTKNHEATLRLQSGMTYALNGPTEFVDLNINPGSGKTVISARFNPLVMGDGLKLSSGNMFIVGGYQTLTDKTPTNKNSNVTIKSGTYDAVIGFSRGRNNGNLTYTGTANISIYGGKVTTVYGASTLYHFSGSCNIKVYGGTVGTLCTGGDATRRLDGTSNIEIIGGKVTTVHINNAIGDTTVKLDGGSVSVFKESFASTTIESLASGALRNLSYNSAAYSADKIEKISKGIFDNVSVYGHAYVKQGANGSGRSADDAAGDLATAIKLVASGGEVEIIGNYTASDFTEPEHSGVIGITAGEGQGGKLILGGTYTLNGPTSLKIQTEGSYDINANGYALRLDSGFGSSDTIKVYGTFDSSKDSFVYSEANGVMAIYASRSGQAADKKGVIEIGGGKVATVGASESGTTDASISVSVNGGEVEKLVLDGTRGSIAISAQAGKLGSVSAAGVSSSSGNSLSYNTEEFDAKLFDGIQGLFGEVSNVKKMYAKDGASGNGLSPANPTSFTNAYELLKNVGGVIVICGTTTIDKTINTAANTKLITVTSVDGGNDYRTSGAKLVLGGGIAFNGDVVIEELNITLAASGPKIKFNAHNGTIGENVVITKPDAYDYYPNVVGGKSSAFGGEYTVTIKSGIFNSLNLAGDAENGKAYGATANLIIDGGEFLDPVYAAGVTEFKGNVNVTVNGGVLRAGLYGSGNNASASFSGDMRFTLNGGAIIGKIACAYLPTTMLNGNMYLELNGGEFAGVTDILGPDEFKGRMEPNVAIGKDVDIFAKEEGTASYSNPVVAAGDPWVVYKDGYYYFTRTSGSSIGIAKATNIGDLAEAPLVTVFKPASGQMYSKNLWSPELHYFSAEDFDNEYFTKDMEGWYLILACDNGDNANHRMYVLKALTDDPQGAYGHPETKAANVPAKITSDTDDTVNSVWTIGQTFAKIKNQLYCFWVSEKTEGTRRYQTIHISMMKNPWTATGKTAIICQPTEPWEKVGATYTPSADGTLYPEVVEGIAIVTAPTGEVFMLYCGSGYWSSEYCLGQLKLVGEDPINYDSWYKYPQPILKKNTEMNGTGHCCYTTSPDGSINYIIYHAYMGNDTKGDRFMIAEEYTVSADGVKIGEGTGRPAPLSKVYTAPVNTMPIIKKLSGWDDCVESFIKYDDYTVGIGSALTITPILSNGDSYTAEKYGTIEYEHKLDGEAGKFTEGLPDCTQAGVYICHATIVGNDDFSGITTAFKITVDASIPVATETSAPDTTDTAPIHQDGGSNALPIIIGGAVIIVAAVVIVLLAAKKKKS